MSERDYYDDDDDYRERYDDEEDPFEEFGCLFGAECCMPGLHFTSECHTAEMAEEMMRAEV